MLLGREVGVGPSPSPKKGVQPSPIFGPCLLWPNGWMDQDATWYEGRPQLRRHCVTRGPSAHAPQRGTAPNFRPMFIVAKRPPISATAEHLWKVSARIGT